VRKAQKYTFSIHGTGDISPQYIKDNTKLLRNGEPVDIEQIIGIKEVPEDNSYNISLSLDHININDKLSLSFRFKMDNYNF
jgi:hypothetical protein